MGIYIPITTILIILLIVVLVLSGKKEKESKDPVELINKYFNVNGFNVIPHREHTTKILRDFAYIQYDYKLNDENMKREMDQYLKLMGVKDARAWNWLERFPDKPYFIIAIHTSNFDFARDTIPRKDLPSSEKDDDQYDENAIRMTWAHASELRGASNYITPEEVKRARRRHNGFIIRYLEPTNGHDIHFTLWKKDNSQRLSIHVS